MNTERIKEIQSKTAYPNSQSVASALLQVWNECKQETNKNISDSLKQNLERYDLNICNCAQGPHTYSEKSDTGDWVRFEDVEKAITDIAHKMMGDEWYRRGEGITDLMSLVMDVSKGFIPNQHHLELHNKAQALMNKTDSVLKTESV